jgi:hypothetical protein
VSVKSVADERKGLDMAAQTSWASEVPVLDHTASKCGRCHNPPQQLSPRITGTVLRGTSYRSGIFYTTDEQKTDRVICGYELCSALRTSTTF